MRIKLGNQRLMVLKEVQKLAVNYSKEYWIINPEIFNSDLTDEFLSMIGDNEEDSSLFNKKRELISYLEGLSYDDVQFVQTAMYVGRDGQSNIDDPETVYDEMFSELNWSGDKSIEIHQISEKILKLEEYLEEAMKILF
ncbi:MAG: hypothetical protein MR320_14845 [Enterococcus gallinarum]|uniref:Uncharacterized protein n=1 Tax=Enterococcus casseliflavus TaxID=37734 RepID=A0A6N3DW75_ENTCA|nr:hypothetical protein [Enterococcus gallinarum]MCI5686644.1 hypothetical protein [Enterococcus gallinarum]MDY4072538.1 hypothetical protein [Enterococcus gallinarum]